MQIFVMRHGQAEMSAASDALRALTANGVNEATDIGRWLSKERAEFDAIFVSSYLRAQQTADVVCAQLVNVGKRETLNFITPEDNPKTVHDYLDAISGDESIQKILLVSHMPLVSYLVAELTTDHSMPIFQTASVAQIDYDKKSMQGALVALTSPNELDINHA